MTLYELNQAAYSAIPDMTKEKIENACENIIRPFLDKNPSSYYLLLNNDLHYYTFFVFNEFSSVDNLIEELIELVKDLGPIKSIEVNDNCALEFWVKNKDTVEAFLFFDYKMGVIEIP